MGFPDFYPGNLTQFSGTLFEVEFLQDMLPSLAIAVTLAADAMTDFWMEPIGAGKVERKPNKSVFFLNRGGGGFNMCFFHPCMWKGSNFTKIF